MNANCPNCQQILAEDDWIEDRLAAGDTCSDGLFYCLDCLTASKCPCGGFVGEHTVLVPLGAEREQAVLEKAEAQLREAIAALDKGKA